MSYYCDTPFAMIFDVARAERALENYKLVTPAAYELEATRSGCNREGFKLLQKYTMTSFFSHLAGQDIMRYLEGQIIIGPAPQPYPANYNCLVCQLKKIYKAEVSVSAINRALRTVSLHIPIEITIDNDAARCALTNLYLNPSTSLLRQPARPYLTAAV